MVQYLVVYHQFSLFQHFWATSHHLFIQKMRFIFSNVLLSLTYLQGNELTNNLLLQRQNVERAKLALLGDKLGGETDSCDSNLQSDHLLMMVAYKKWEKILREVCWEDKCTTQTSQRLLNSFSMKQTNWRDFLVERILLWLIIFSWELDWNISFKCCTPPLNLMQSSVFISCWLIQCILVLAEWS